ncbi:MAG: hypothetical protein JWN03_5350 [Nocardia sp.]|uniref:hypothetical protein n=1 Tax=Nocardia sp. TaxID=1821 RepID=UPI00263406C8|nr:hypothetical protein [Nocardia sp.]MCU1645075.1 hypothetical protein [Nocardia sp.]
MTAGPGSRTAVVAALTIVACAALTCSAPFSGASGGCGTDLNDVKGEFTAQEGAFNVLQFDGAGGITFRSDRHGNGTGIYAIIPTGGFTAAMKMSDNGSEDARAATAAVKSMKFACAAPGTQVTTFTSLDQNARSFDYARS